MFQVVPGLTAAEPPRLLQVNGRAYPIEVIGNIAFVNDGSLAKALVFSNAPQLNLDRHLAEFYASLGGCSGIGGGACYFITTPTEPEGLKGPQTGVCK